jgi:hypothetical protein
LHHQHFRLGYYHNDVQSSAAGVQEQHVRRRYKDGVQAMTVTTVLLIVLFTAVAAVAIFSKPPPSHTKDDFNHD